MLPAMNRGANNVNKRPAGGAQMFVAKSKHLHQALWVANALFANACGAKI